jgi:hypothetical protein
MAFISNFRAAGHITSVNQEESRAGKRYAKLRLMGENDNDLEILFYGQTQAERVANYVEGDCVLVIGRIGSRVNQGGYYNCTLFGDQMLRIEKPSDAVRDPKPLERDEATDDSDLPF